MSLLYSHDFKNKQINSNYCFDRLFLQSTNLISSYYLKMPKYINGFSCLIYMFGGCINMEYGPEILPAYHVGVEQYIGIFSSCYKLKNAPEIYATTYDRYSFLMMFSYCVKINEIKCHFQYYDNTNKQFENWLNNVSPTGTFWLPYDSVFADDAPRNGNGIPEGWTIRYFDPETGLERDRLYPIS